MFTALQQAAEQQQEETNGGQEMRVGLTDESREQNEGLTGVGGMGGSVCCPHRNAKPLNLSPALIIIS